MGVNSNTADNETSPTADMSMASKIVLEKMELNSCPSSEASCISPDQNSNGVMDVSFDGESGETMNNGDSDAAVMEADINTDNSMKESPEEDIEEKEESEFPHEPGKIFIGGLNPCTTIETLKFYFRKYGEIKNSLIMRDIVTKKSRGFGFVTFVDPSVVEQVLNDAPHTLDSKRIEPKIAVPKQMALKAITNALTRTKKVFIGGLPASTTKESLIEFFSQFGQIDNCELIYDKDTKRMRGFGFIHFATEDAAEEVVNRKLFIFNNKQIEAKKAVPKEVISNSNAALRQQLEAQNITIPPVNPTSVAATAAGAATNQYLGAASMPAAAAAAALATPGGPALPLPSLPLVNVGGLPQQRIPQTQQQPRLSAPSAMQQVALQSALNQQQGMECLMPFYSNGGMLPQPDLLNLYPYPQPTLLNSNLNAADYAQSTLGASFGGAPPTLAQFHSRVSTSYPTGVGLPAPQQTLLNPSSHAGFEAPNILQPTLMQNPAAFQQFSTALLNSFLQQQIHQQATAAAVALQLQGSQVPSSLVPTTSTIAASNANSLGHAHNLADRQSVNPIPNGQGVVLQQGPQSNVGVSGQVVPANAAQGISSTENPPAVSQSSQVVAEANSVSYTMPAKIPRENYALFEMQLWTQ